MFLNYGAGLHGHEFSHRTENANQNNPRRNPSARSAFSTPIRRRNTVHENSVRIIRPALPLSDHIVHPLEHSQAENPTRPLDQAVRFKFPEPELEPEPEPDPNMMGEDERSLANSEDSKITVGGLKRQRRPLRSRYLYHIAHPAPTLTQTQRLLQIRPKLLLQLQLLSPDTRPKPFLDVLPSTVLLPRVAKKFPRMFRGKGALGCNDVMIVKSEDYDTGNNNNLEDSESDEDGLVNRDLMAVICPMPRDRGGSQGIAEIVLSNGSIWIATPVSKNLYEFCTIDDRGHEVTARWSKWTKRSGKNKSMDSSECTGANPELKYVFSMIDPDSRRHPIMGTITHTLLEIPECYTSVSTSAGKYPPTSVHDGVKGAGDIEGLSLPKRSTHPIDETTKTLIQVTGIWVSLRQGWCPYFKYDDPFVNLTTAPTPVNSRFRSCSLTPDNGRQNPVSGHSNTPEFSNIIGSALENTIRRVSVRGHPRKRSQSQSELQPIQQRSVSAGTAFMQRAAARRAGPIPSVVDGASDAEGHIDQPRRSIIETSSGSIKTQTYTPSPRLSRPCSSIMTSDTPMYSHRRIQSAQFTYNPLQHSSVCGYSRSNSKEIIDENFYSDPKSKQLTGRWKAFVNFFRRTKHSSGINQL